MFEIFLLDAGVRREMRDLSFCMNPGIRSSGAVYNHAVTGVRCFFNGSLEALLDGSLFGLHLPSGKAGAVVFDFESYFPHG
jgi:hypothetical protein